MVEEDKKFKEDYRSRYSSWRDITINQMSSVNNTVTALELGFLAYIFKPELITCFNLLSISLVFLVLSILLGLLILLTRLYDFRISRHLAMTRMRFVDQHGSTTGLLPCNEDKDYNLCDRLRSFLKIVFCKIDFVSKTEIKEKTKAEIVKKFTKLQELSSILGSTNWRWMKLQILLFLVSIFIYSLNLVINNRP